MVLPPSVSAGDAQGALSVAGPQIRSVNQYFFMRRPPRPRRPPRSRSRSWESPRRLSRWLCLSWSECLGTGRRKLISFPLFLHSPESSGAYEIDSRRSESTGCGRHVYRGFTFH
jgi:hypothetical protein